MTDIEYMVYLVNGYEFDTQMIDSYRQQMEAEEHNRWLEREFTGMMRKVSDYKTYDGGIPGRLLSRKYVPEEKVREYINLFKIPTAWLPKEQEA